MGDWGFSVVGAVFLAGLFVPNLLWARAKPTGYDPRGENRWLVALERVGQVATTASALVFANTNLRPWTAWSLWLVAAVALMVAYEACWVRYFRSPRTVRDFYRSAAGVPVPLASLPVAAFVLLGVSGRLPVLVGSALVLGVGHVGIHLGHRRALSR
ncbi:hypothetical protein [Xylanimonas protaetiae]|uniref:Uncharacterized protein n=1 Tax=Xylanimonas protaetiae TaxID=2509457 RepID=A0A4P6EZS6_9MICO|nr:hypothetical protein [Xylanimonas protaetiae]QAY68672.1 hypothetical protein ET471_00280 [Xylanimonas protaetiae]